VRGSFQETVPRKTAENTVKQCGGGVGSVVAKHSNGGENSVVPTTLIKNYNYTLMPSKDKVTHYLYYHCIYIF